jgi:hypothetical protein
MSDEQHNNLPADFDNLSVYAPHLTLIARGDHFTVPEGYFDALTDRVMTQTALPIVKDNFILPENDANELMDKVEALRNLPVNDGFSVGDDYFSSLATSIENKILFSAQNEKSIDAVPENYLEELSSSVKAHLALDNLKPEDGFTIPDRYFKQLNNSIQKIIAREEFSIGSGTEVPEDYFEQLPNQVIAKLTTPQQTVKVIPLRRFWQLRAVAAGVALLLISGAFLLFQVSSTNEIQYNGRLLSHTDFSYQLPLQQIQPPTIQNEQSVVPRKYVTVTTKIKTKKINPTISPTQTEELDFDLLDEQIVAEYAAERLNDQEIDTDDDLQYYIENVELGDILPGRPGTK